MSSDYTVLGGTPTWFKRSANMPGLYYFWFGSGTPGTGGRYGSCVPLITTSWGGSPNQGNHFWTIGDAVSSVYQGWYQYFGGTLPYAGAHAWIDCPAMVVGNEGYWDTLTVPANHLEFNQPPADDVWYQWGSIPSSDYTVLGGTPTWFKRSANMPGLYYFWFGAGTPGSGGRYGSGLASFATSWGGSPNQGNHMWTIGEAIGTVYQGWYQYFGGTLPLTGARVTISCTAVTVGYEGYWNSCYFPANSLEFNQPPADDVWYQWLLSVTHSFPWIGRFQMCKVKEVV